jgi:acetylornithine deacetylase
MQAKNCEAEVLSLLKKLCDIPSPSGREDIISSFIYDYLRDIGFKAIIKDSNVIVNPDADFLISTHLDTVKKRMPFHFDGKTAYGTGVSDAKGSITSILLALREMDELKYTVAFFVEEEEGGNGSKTFCDSFSPKMAVVMEPTSLRIAKEHYGNIEVEIKTKGRSAHGSMPERGINAIEECFKTIKEIERLSGIKPTILKIVGGGDDYCIPDYCTAVVDLLIPPYKDVGVIYKRIEQLELTVKEFCNGFVSGKSAEMVERAMSNLGLDVKHTTMPSWTDAINLHSHGVDVVVWGPGDLSLCHTKDERVELREILLAKEVLKELNSVLNQ